MIKTLRRLYRMWEESPTARWWYDGRRGHTGMPTFERKRKMRALARWEAERDDMCDRSRGSCCPTCLFGHQYLYVVDKIERIRKELGLPTE